MEYHLNISLQKRRLQDELKRLRTVFAELIEKREKMLVYEKPRLEAMYMDAIGQLQFEKLMVRLEIALLRLERDLLQSYVNRGEEPDIESVNEQVEETSREYHENLRQESEKIDEAKNYIKLHFDDDSEQSLNRREEIKRIYRKLVQKLHPDLHPNQTEQERELFLQVQKAYEDGDLERLQQLEELLETGGTTEKNDCGSIEELEEQIARLKEQIDAVTEEINQLEESFPFTYCDKLNDPEWIRSEQEEIRAQIEMMKQERDMLKVIVEQMKK